MSGSGVESIGPAMVKPQEFFGTRQDEWLVVDFAPSPRTTGEGIPGAVHIAMNSDAAKKFGKVLKLEAQKRGALFRVLVVSDGDAVAASRISRNGAPNTINARRGRRFTVQPTK